MINDKLLTILTRLRTQYRDEWEQSSEEIWTKIQDARVELLSDDLNVDRVLEIAREINRLVNTRNFLDIQRLRMVLSNSSHPLIQRIIQEGSEFNGNFEWLKVVLMELREDETLRGAGMSGITSLLALVNPKYFTHIGESVINKALRKCLWGDGTPIVGGQWKIDKAIELLSAITSIVRQVGMSSALEVGFYLSKFNVDEFKDVCGEGDGIMEELNELLLKKGQVILYGPPGTGKTWLAREYVIEKTREEKPGNRWVFITFHQSYSYEEFIEGFRPKTDNNGEIRYEVEDGIFKKMVIKAIWSAIVRDFENVWNLFRKVYPEGSSLKTKTGNEFRIVRFTEGGLFIKPENGSNEHHLSTKNLRLLWKHGEVQTIPEVTSIIGDTGSGSYYFAVYQALLGLLNPGGDYNEVKKHVIEHLRSGKVIDFSNAPKFYLIIDEINRGNISKIFGELITLLEKDKRLGGENQLIVTLPYSGEPFAVPPNLYIIGTMNTADKSIALLDVALRRRFAFIEVEPNPEKLMNKTIEGINLAELLKTLNDRITVVKDSDHRIGHSYFLNVETVDELKRVWYYEVLPLLMEYFYNDWETIKWVLNEKDKDSGDVFFEKLNTIGLNGEEAYHLKVLEGDAFVRALKRIIGKNTSSQEGGATTNEENSPENNQSQSGGD